MMAAYREATVRGAYGTWKPRTLWQATGKRLRKLLGTIVRDWPERRRQRLDLSEMTDERLRDLGISRREQARECRKFFWQ